MDNPGGRIEKRALLSGAVLIAGLVLPQCILYGPSLFGSKLLLPLEALRSPALLPAQPADAPPIAADAAGDLILSDAVFQFEPQRHFATASVRAGRFPLWDPLSFCGAPFLASNQTSLLSPLRLLDYAWPSPRVIAWRELLKALLAGIGAFLFFRRALAVRFWAAAFGAWCFPLCGFLVLWANHPQSSVAIWLPWILLFTESSLQRPRGPAPIGLAVTTALALQSGHAGIAANLLIASALYALGRCIAARELLRWRPLFALAAGWSLGVMLSAAQTLPTLDYLGKSARMVGMLAVSRADPSPGARGLVQLLLPYALGAHGEGFVYLAPGNRLESAAAGYAGLLVALCLAPAGLARAWRRGVLPAAGLFFLFGLAGLAGLPLLSTLFRHTIFAELQNQRMVLLAAFATLSLAALGLDALLDGELPGPLIRSASLLALAAIGLWSAWGAFSLPTEFLAMHARAVLAAHTHSAIPPFFDLPHLIAAHGRFIEASLFGALFAVLGALFVIKRMRWLPLLCALALAELVWMATGVNPQRDAALYFPPIPAVEQLKPLPWGRALCVRCMPANLLAMQGLPDLRGYDGVDPSLMIQLLELFRSPITSPRRDARVQWFAPRVPSPLADLLGLRYLIFPGDPPPGSEPISRSPGYFVLENRSALPRAFVPERWLAEPEPLARLQQLADPKFQPRQLAIVNEELPLPHQEVHGSAEVLEDDGDRLLVDARLDGAGLVVIADAWDDGWRAFADGRELPLLIADHALRAVPLPAGETRVELRYQPQSFASGLRIAGAAALILLLWSLALFSQKRARWVSAPPVLVEVK